MNVRLLLFLYFVSLLNRLHSQNLCRKADTTSIPTTFMGTAIPTKLLGTVYFDKSCLNDTKAMVDKDHLTHMLDMVFREDILQKDLVIIKTHTVVLVGRKERLIFLYYSDIYIGIKTVNLILHAIVKTQPSTQLNLRQNLEYWVRHDFWSTTPSNHPPTTRNSDKSHTLLL